MFPFEEMFMIFILCDYILKWTLNGAKTMFALPAPAPSTFYSQVV